MESKSEYTDNENNINNDKKINLMNNIDEFDNDFKKKYSNLSGSDSEDDNISNKDGKNCCQRYFSKIGEGSLRGSTIAMASITFGGGCLSFPYAIAQTGPIVGLIIYVFIGIVSYWTIYLLMVNGYDSNTMNYNDLTVKAMGNKWRIIADICNLILCFGLIVGYQYIISSLCLQVLNYFFELECKGTVKVIQIIICAVFIQIPMSCLKDISKLQYLSISGTLALIISTLVIIVEFPFYLDQYLKAGNTIKLFPDYDTFKIGWIDTLGIYLFGFSSHNGIFQIFDEMKRPKRRRCLKVIRRAFYLEAVLYFLISFAGFFSTFYDTPDVFLKRKNLNGFKNDYVIITVKILLIVTLNSCMAMNYNIMRMSYVSMFFDNKKPTFTKDFFVVVFIYILSNIITYFLNNAGTLLSFLGGLTSVVICFIVPYGVDIKINPETKSKSRIILNYVSLVLMICIGLLCSGKSLYDFIYAKDPLPVC